MKVILINILKGVSFILSIGQFAAIIYISAVHNGYLTANPAVMWVFFIAVVWTIISTIKIGGELG